MKNKKRIALILLVCLCASIFAGCGEEEQKQQDVNFDAVSDICELATLQCYYHNVAKGETEEEGALKEKLKVGYKQYWVEYSGVIEYGIDVSQVSVSEPTSDGVVTVTIPDAEVLSVELDEETFGEELEDSGLFTKVTQEDKTEALAKAQEEMKEKAAEDTDQLKQAKTRAEKLIENYIVTVGEQIGETYTVEWVDAQ